MATGVPSSKPLAPGPIALTAADLPPMGDSPEATRFDLSTLWPADRRDRPIEIEIGSGKGTFLVQQATATAEVNFLGVEWAAQYCRHAADRMRRHGLDHVRMLRADAAEFVRWYVADLCVRQVHVYFPDPWPKKRHHKRRLIQPPFLRELNRILVPGGRVRLVTDHADYFAWMEQAVAEVGELFERRPFERPIGAAEGEVVGTNFERKYRREGRLFQGMTLAKRG